MKNSYLDCLTEMGRAAYTSYMPIADLLEQIRPTWLTRVTHRMAHGEGVREIFVQQLDQFYDLLERCVETGNPSWLDPLLTEWVKARTKSELESKKTSIPPILGYFLLLTFEVARDALSEADTLVLMGGVLPIYVYASEFATRCETQIQVDHITEELNKATLALEKLDRNKSDFIAVAAHELRTPLTLIEGYCSMLREVLTPTTVQTVAGVYLRGIDTGSQRLREIVNDMIDVSMIDNNLLSITFQPLWINRLLNVLQRELKEWVAERGQNLKIVPFQGYDEMTFGDGERLLQAMRNLITNAIKYTPDGGQIVVDGRLLPGFIEITVTDSGIGIDPDDHLRIFEKFGRLGSVSLHSSSKIKFKGGGPGLGLPITKGIIEAHGGAIWVESPGYDEVKCPGSIFHVLLPLRKEPPDPRGTRLFRGPTS
jgi:signal transduction histidine kinase